MKKIPEKIKCPRCKCEGHTYKEERMNWYQCDGLCQWNTLLRFLNIK